MILKIIFLMLLLFFYLEGGEYKKDVLDRLSYDVYNKKYVDLNKVQKIHIKNKSDKIDRIYTMAMEHNVTESNAYKRMMHKAQRSIAMNTYLKSVRDSIEVSDKEIEDYYALHKKEYYTYPHAYTIVRKEKKDLLAYLNILNHTDKSRLKDVFISLAKKYSQHPRKSRGGDMGYIGYNSIAKPFGEFTFELNENSYTPKPFKTVLGYHLVYVEDIQIKSIQEVHKTIEATLRQNKYIEWFKNL